MGLGAVCLVMSVDKEGLLATDIKNSMEKAGTLANRQGVAISHWLL